MKCPSKEIDKNNISLLLPNHNFSIVSLNLNIRYVCFFWLSCGVFLFFFFLFFCSPRRSDVFVSEQAGGRGRLRLRNSPVCPQRSVPRPLGRSQAERLQGHSLFLSDADWALARSHTANPPCCVFRPAAGSAALRCREARGGCTIVA